MKDGLRYETSDKKRAIKAARQKLCWVLKMVWRIPSLLKALTQTLVQTAHIKEKHKKKNQQLEQKLRTPSVIDRDIRS